MKSFFQLLIKSFKEWKDDNATSQAAALSYYTIFSLAPLITIIITLLGLFYSESDLNSVFMEQVTELIGPSAKQIFKSIIDTADKPNASSIAAIISLVTMIFGATGVFVQLKNALNTTWKVKEQKSEGITGMVKVRAIAFTGIVAFSFLLLVSLFASTIIITLTRNIVSNTKVYLVLLEILNQVIAVGVITVFFALIFKYLPDANVAWKDVWIGALFTSVLFNIGKYGIGLYLGNSNIGSALGAAGSVLIVLLWVYYSALIVLFGAKFTYVYSERYGSGTREIEESK